MGIAAPVIRLSPGAGCCKIDLDQQQTPQQPAPHCIRTFPVELGSHLEAGLHVLEALLVGGAQAVPLLRARALHRRHFLHAVRARAREKQLRRSSNRCADGVLDMQPAPACLSL